MQVPDRNITVNIWSALTKTSQSLVHMYIVSTCLSLFTFYFTREFCTAMEIEDEEWRKMAFLLCQRKINCCKVSLYRRINVDYMHVLAWCNLYCSYRYRQCQMQERSGYFPLAFARVLANGSHPNEYYFHQSVDRTSAGVYSQLSP